ncbi:MAG: hypothetical protein ACFB0D_19340 [Phormidesmis sp.]
MPEISLLNVQINVSAVQLDVPAVSAPDVDITNEAPTTKAP